MYFPLKFKTQCPEIFLVYQVAMQMTAKTNYGIEILMNISASET